MCAGLCLIVNSSDTPLTCLLHSTNCSIVGGTGRDNSKSASPLIVRTRQLRCHECYMSIHGEACIELDTAITDVQYCRDDESYCVVS